jgi:hypothetical protein
MPGLKIKVICFFLMVMMMVRFRANGYSDLADRLVELQYELTDRLTCFIGGKRVDHKTGQHILLPDLHEK